MSFNWTFVKKNAATEFTILIAISATFTYLFTGFSDFKAARERVTYAEMEAFRTRNYIQKLEANLNDRNLQTQAVLNDLSKLIAQTPPGPSRLAQQVALMKQDINNLNKETTDLKSNAQKLDSLIESSPEKALAVPLLTKDLNDFKVASQHDIDSLRSEMLRGYELNKWLIGLMLAAVLGLVLKSAFETKTASSTPRPTFE